MTKQIKIRIFSDGKIESETVGIKGKECLSYIKEIQNLTGGTIINSEFTKEYHEVEQRINTSNKGYQYDEN